MDDDGHSPISNKPRSFSPVMGLGATVSVSELLRSRSVGLDPNFHVDPVTGQVHRSPSLADLMDTELCEEDLRSDSQAELPLEDRAFALKFRASTPAHGSSTSTHSLWEAPGLGPAYHPAFPPSAPLRSRPQTSRAPFARRHLRFTTARRPPAAMAVDGKRFFPAGDASPLAAASTGKYTRPTPPPRASGQAAVATQATVAPTTTGPPGVIEDRNGREDCGACSPQDALHELPIAMINRYGSGHLILDSQHQAPSMLSTDSFTPLFDELPAASHTPSPGKHPAFGGLHLRQGFEMKDDRNQEVLVVNDQSPPRPHGQGEYSVFHVSSSTFPKPGATAANSHGMPPRSAAAATPGSHPQAFPTRSIPSRYDPPAPNGHPSVSLRQSPVRLEPDFVYSPEPESLSDNESECVGQTCVNTCHAK